MGMVEGGEGHKQRWLGKGGWDRDLQEILFGSSKSAPEAHYYCPQGAKRGEGPDPLNRELRGRAGSCGGWLPGWVIYHLH
jgi:hypothetical protein